ncbi:MAG: hypothetical protein A3E19_02305 [Planctomycetes bacterium RIFCSPHIGHO2_12_FULL_52_36]|nr:MAG: hypothetical protein A3D89_01070 [Planctomycetes bacterium RIFCSPHIGHO2_02_FULL_52_58]OHB93847.1 MAG: hypothetical protein A3E19_02305 [Planctomycetes bacterium RIFCSPHIGHO2_12_FULL_52_36]
MDAEIIKAIGVLGPTARAVIVVYLFIGYLRDRDTHLTQALGELKEAVEKLADKTKNRNQ